MPKSLTFESFTGGLAQDNDPTIVAHNVWQETEMPVNKEPFGLELFTTITAPELRLGTVACVLSKYTQVDDSTGAQDRMETTNPLIIDNSTEARSLN